MSVLTYRVIYIFLLNSWWISSALWMIVIIRKTDPTNYSQVEKQFPSCLNGKSKNRLGVCGKECQGRVANPIRIYPPISVDLGSVLFATHILYHNFLVFQVYYERPMVIDSLNLKLRQIVRFSSNVILDEMSSAFLDFFDCWTWRKTTLPCTNGNLLFFDCWTRRKTTFTMYIW